MAKAKTANAKRRRKKTGKKRQKSAGRKTMKSAKKIKKPAKKKQKGAGKNIMARKRKLKNGIPKKLLIKNSPAAHAQIPAIFHGKEFYKQSAKIYSLPSQINLVMHGTPFHLINDDFVRFHAVQSTIVGWKFTILYAIIIASTFANLYLFEGTYLGIILDILLISVILHLLLNSFLGFEASHGKRVMVPIMGQVAKRIAGVR
ncbi:hypothetical protein COU37_03450 [Candidatus Micrarchaeota archaeon CG10_big_fil_rev_8_21_14_0_10_45_29]|nr:MAG: hypothetical protein COU37_03450 [Candidatus Micrarchaeota archaeon CG10_big_fil_rev_8_21_14_0_10_45_29]